MCRVDGSHARVGVVVGIHAEAERFIVPKWCGAPMTVVVAVKLIEINYALGKQSTMSVNRPETIHFLRQALLLHFSLPVAFSFLLLLTLFL